MSPSILFCILLTLILGFQEKPAEARSDLCLAVVGPMSGKDSSSGQAMLDAVRLRVQEVNRNGGIHGKNVRLKIFDNKRDKGLARSRAREIAEKSGCVAVIGHYYSALSLVGGEIYREKGIPAVTGSATTPELTENNDWYFRVISNNDLQGKLSALYVSRVLGHSSVSIVYEKDAYGMSLQRSFRAAAEKLGLAINNIWHVTSDEATRKRRLEEIHHQLQQEKSRPDMLYLALLDQESAFLVKRIRESGMELPILGGDAMGLGTFTRILKSYLDPAQNMEPYTREIYATTYFIQDIANKKAQEFSRDFFNMYNRFPDALNAAYYDAAGIVLQALKRVDTSRNIADQRKQLRKVLQRFSHPDTYYPGVTGDIHFDSMGNAINPSPFGTYVNDNLVSAPIQLTQVHNPERILDAPKLIREGTMISFEEDLYHKTNVVYTGIDINEIRRIDQKSETFAANFYLWFRHKNPLDYSRIEIANCDITKEDMLDPKIDSVIDGMMYRVYKFDTKFEESFQYQDYPFDTQNLSIQLRHREFNRERLIFVADKLGMQQHKGSSMMDRLRQHSGFQGEKRWNLENIVVYTDIGEADSTLGNPRMFQTDEDTGISFSRFNVDVRVKRNPSSYVFKNMVPLFFIFILGYAMSFIFPEGPPFAARLNLGVILLLTASSLSLMTANQLPSIGYLVTMDYMYFFVYFWLLLGILVTIAVRSAHLNQRNLLRRRLERCIRIIQPVLLFTVLIVILSYYVW